ncbi:MAG: hypothetical protein ACK5U7_07660 [Bacteroidota bacterium]|jgi:hypothetical protein
MLPDSPEIIAQLTELESLLNKSDTSAPFDLRIHNLFTNALISVRYRSGLHILHFEFPNEHSKRAPLIRDNRPVHVGVAYGVLHAAPLILEAARNARIAQDAAVRTIIGTPLSARLSAPATPGA